MKRKKLIIFLIIAAVLISLFLYFYIDGYNIQITNYTLEHKSLPKNFEGFKITQVSDLHNKNFEDLEEKIKETQPDIIIISGDMIDKRTPNVEIARNAAKIMTGIAPTYFTSGNHEQTLKEKKPEIYKEFYKMLKEEGVIVLENEKTPIYIGSEKINIAGVTDTSITKNNKNNGELDQNKMQALTRNINALTTKEEFDILISHRPSTFEITSDLQADIIFSGHAHGGQIRIPEIAENGIMAPDEGFMPKYTSGKFILNNTCMIVSRGMGDSVFPVRINNPPEIVTVTLKCK